MNRVVVFNSISFLEPQLVEFIVIIESQVVTPLFSDSRHFWSRETLISQVGIHLG